MDIKALNCPSCGATINIQAGEKLGSCNHRSDDYIEDYSVPAEQEQFHGFSQDAADTASNAGNPGKIQG